MEPDQTFDGYLCVTWPMIERALQDAELARNRLEEKTERAKPKAKKKGGPKFKGFDESEDE